MYDALTPLFDHVDRADLFTDFKSEGFGLSGDGPGHLEPVPYAGVTIIRDRYDVPHVYATTHDGGVWAAGWIAAQDRGLLLALARYDSLTAAVDAPGLSAIRLVEADDQFTPSAQTEAIAARQEGVLRRAGTEGRDVLSDINVYCRGINAYLKATHTRERPFTPVDIIAFNALKDQFLGEGGGREAANSELLAGLEHRLGVARGYRVFADLRQNTNAGSPTTVDGHFAYDDDPSHPGAPGSVLLDPGSLHAVSSVSPRVARELPAAQPRAHASNELMVEAGHSRTGHPLLVGGPQIGYSYPGLTYEIDMHAPGLDWRGATSAPFPGYLLIGRGQDFATTLTSADGDDIDEFVETLCGHSRTHYLYRGRCRAMTTVHAGTLKTQSGARSPVVFERTVNGPVVAYATVHGHPVAIARRRASYGRDVLDLLYNRRLSDGQVHSPRTFMQAAALTPQTFNSFYIDDRHVAEYTAGLLPIRARGTDPSLPTRGGGAYEWRGDLSAARHPHGVDPAHTPVPGTMVNWNNTVAHGFGAADDQWASTGSAARVQELNRDLVRQRHHGKWTIQGVVSAMNEAASQDVRGLLTVPLLARVLHGSAAPDPQAAEMLRLLISWSRHGASLLGNGHGKIRAPGAAIIQTAWKGLADAAMAPVLGPQLAQLNDLSPRFGGYSPGGGQFAGWYQYMDRDLKHLLGIAQPQPLADDYCGAGSLARCRASLWRALAAAGRTLTRSQGTADPARWRASAGAIRIHFVPLGLTTMRYANRPTGIQQVISFDRHGG